MAHSELIDAELLRQVSDTWQKGAMIVAKAMSALPSIGDSKLTQRLVALVEAGALECQGDPSNIRFSEVRLPRSGGSR